MGGHSSTDYPRLVSDVSLITSDATYLLKNRFDKLKSRERLGRGLVVDERVDGEQEVEGSRQEHERGADEHQRERHLSALLRLRLLVAHGTCISDCVRVRACFMFVFLPAVCFLRVRFRGEGPMLKFQNFHVPSS